MIDIKQAIELKIQTLQKELDSHSEWFYKAKDEYLTDEKVRRTYRNEEVLNASKVMEICQARIDELKWCLNLY